MTRHLDLGCGATPRNPYDRDEVHAVDLMAPTSLPADRFRRANLSLEAIPYPDRHFDSVSAYDFLEHIPRILTTANGQGTRFPFLDLMAEIHRVLTPGGRFYAVTPGFPSDECMVDPTHVNYIAARTHRYFCEPHVGAQIYGYVGRFRAVRVDWLRPKFAYEPVSPDVRHRLRRLGDLLMRRRSHLLWEFEAVK